MSCSVPLSVGLQYSYKKSKLAWADSIVYVATRNTQLLCVDETNMCIPLEQSYGAGTSFVIKKIFDQTVIMTAAHLCYAHQGGESQSVMNGIATIETKFDMSIGVGEELFIVNNILFLDVENDICVFSVPVDIGRVMPISRFEPSYGDEVWSIGAPAGYFPESAKPITKGIFSGSAERVYNNGEKIEFYNFSMPTVGGMSGSPIINKSGEVVGIVSAVNSEWHMISFSPTLSQIKESIGIAILKLAIQNP